MIDLNNNLKKYLQLIGIKIIFKWLFIENYKKIYNVSRETIKILIL